MNDPVSLLSTLSQSTAAMVAIIGGFLVSRLVALSSEREGIVRQLNAARQRLKLRMAEYKPAHKYRLRNSIAKMEEWLLDSLIDERDKTKDQELSEIVDIPRGSSLKEMLPYAKKVQAKVDQAFEDVLALVKDSDNDLMDFDELVRRGLSFLDDDRNLYERVGWAVINSLPGTTYSSIMSPARQSQRALLSYKPPHAHEIEMRRLDESIREEQELHAQVVADEHEVRRLERELGAFSQPVGVTPAIWILCTFSLLGIMAPLLVMAFWSGPVPHWVIICLIVGFGVGLAAVLGYIGWYKHAISQEPK